MPCYNDEKRKLKNLMWSSIKLGLHVCFSFVVFRFVMCFSPLLIFIKFLFIVAYDFGLCYWSQIKSVVGLGFFVNGCDCVIYVQVKFWVSGVIGPSFLWMVDFVMCLHSSTWLCRVIVFNKKNNDYIIAWS